MSWKRRRRVAFTGEELLQYSLKFWNPGVGHVPDLVQIDADVVVWISSGSAPVCGAGTDGHPSQRSSLAKDPVAHVPVKRFLSPDVDSHSEQLLEIFDEPSVIHQASARLPGHQQIEVAILIGFTTGHRAEHTQAVGTALPGEPKDFRPPFRPQCVQTDHVFIVFIVRQV